MKVINGLKELSARYIKAKKAYKVYLSRVFVCAKITKLMKQRYCRAGGSFHATLVGRVKRNLTFSVATCENTIREKAKDNFGWYMTTSFQFVTRIRTMFKIMYYM